jgi:hypothetical protein
MKERIDDVISYVNSMILKDFAEKGYTFDPELVTADYISDKWCKLVRTKENGTKASVYGFVALADFSTKELGQVKTGDIHRAAGWKKPAKHKRGSVLDDTYKICCNLYGIAYMK